MPTDETPLHRPHRLSLSREEAESLQYGDLPGRPGFTSDEERCAAWFAHRDELLRHCREGKRPAAWWQYESPVPHPPDRDYAPAALYEAELLTESELAELTARWRADFERAQAPGFTLCSGFAKPSDPVATWLECDAARAAHYRWSGIPKALVRSWSAEYRRRHRAIRELKETASPAEAATAPGGHLPPPAA